LQELDGGVGIMFDDLVAGVYGAVVVLIISKVF
jgi:phosphatidylglycerophosphatase A